MTADAWGWVTVAIVALIVFGRWIEHAKRRELDAKGPPPGAMPPPPPHPDGVRWCGCRNPRSSDSIHAGEAFRFNHPRGVVRRPDDSVWIEELCHVNLKRRLSKFESIAGRDAQ